MYSKTQERDADLYAGDMLFKIYGNNQAGIDVMKKIQEDDTLPEFIQYVSEKACFNPFFDIRSSRMPENPSHVYKKKNCTGLTNAA